MSDPQYVYYDPIGTPAHGVTVNRHPDGSKDCPQFTFSGGRWMPTGPD
jgi:hypothetical protein